jgi:sialic acid synthase SpsE
MRTRLILDIGSTHGNSMKRIEKIVELCAEVGAELKFQLFRNLPPNIELNRDLIPTISQLCFTSKVKWFASVWDEEALLLVDDNCPTVKFAYSQRYNYPLMMNAVGRKLEIIRSADDLSDWGTATVNLYCIPLYPIPYIIDFRGLFPPFDGFSDHTRGISQTLAAIKAGAKIIEKHVTTEENDVDCPDAKFALQPSEVRRLVHVITAWEQGQNGSAIRADHPSAFPPL